MTTKPARAATKPERSADDLDSRIREYARQVVAASTPMTPDERAQVVAILRGVDSGRAVSRSAGQART